MKDFFERLTAFARERFELRGRRLSRKKKQRAPGRPAVTGPSAGCGTGKGGFKAGNSCAKEDGRPSLPKSFAQKGKSATAASLPASKEALAAKAAALKSMSKGAGIADARKKAAIRKKEKQDRDAAEMKAAEEARQKKRAELLQKIRIKKANEKLQIDGKDFGLPKQTSPFSGKGDDSAVQRPGELKTEFIKRKYQKDLDAYHAEATKIESRYQKDIADARAESSKHEMLYRATGSEPMLQKKQAADARARDLESKRDSELHDLVGKFTVAHAGSLASTDLLPSSPSVFKNPLIGTSNQGADKARAAITDAWKWLSRVAGKQHQLQIQGVTIKLRGGAGGSHYGMNGLNEATIGVDDTRRGVTKTAVHEYGHAIESGRPDTMRALTQDYRARLADFVAQNPGAKMKGIPVADSYDAVYRAGERVGSFDFNSPSYLGYARRYSDAGFKESVIAEYKNHPDRARMDKGTEVFSTGVESLFMEPSAFRTRARHGHDITLLVLAGLL